MFNASIIGTGSYLPKKLVTNRDLFPNLNNFDIERATESIRKKNLELPADTAPDEIFDIWVRQMSGIEKRYFITQEEMNIVPNSVGIETEVMAYFAAKEAIKDAKIDKSEIDAIVFSTFTNTRLIPNPAITTAALLELNGPATMTNNTACSGFIDAIGDAYAKVVAGVFKNVLVIASEHLSNSLDMTDPTTAILFGDGAAAAIVSRTEESGIIGYNAGSRMSDYITMQSGEKIVMGGGPLVQKNAVQAMYDAAMVAAEKSGKTFEQYDYIIPHQANGRIISQLALKMKVPTEKVIVCIEKMGNISCATIPFALDMLRKNKLENYKYEKGQEVLLTALGGGYTWAGCSIKI